MNKTIEQVQLQSRVVAHLARAIAEIFEDHSRYVHPELMETIGARSARLMETLGDILNGMDACTEDDDWIAPVFEEAHRLWPPSAPAVPIAPDKVLVPRLALEFILAKANFEDDGPSGEGWPSPKMARACDELERALKRYEALMDASEK